MKKILALVMTAAMLLCFASVVMAETAPAGQIAWFDFVEGEEGLTVNGENATYADGAVTLGDATYLTADVDLAGLTEMTIAMKVKTTDTDANWAFEITSEETHTYPAEHYIGLLLNAGIAVERYANVKEDETSARPGSATVATLAANEWNEIVCVFPADGSIVVYVNGEEAATFTQPEGFDLSIAKCIGETPEFKIGKANWGEYAAGTSVDTLAVYSKALTANEVANALEKYEEPEAPQTGVATVALAVVAMLSGAYIVSKKH